MPIHEYTACFNKSDGSQYHWKSFKTYGGARRYIRKKQQHGFFLAFGMSGWYIMRSTCVPTPWQICGVVLAQSKNAIAQNYYVHRG